MSSFQSLFQKIGSLKSFVIGFFLLVLIIAIGFYYTSQRQSVSQNSNTISSELKEVKLEKLEKDSLVISSEAYTADNILNITNFEQSEDSKWQGGGVLDEKVSFEGNKSLSLVSINHNEVTSYMKKDLDLSNVEYFEMMVNISDSTALESVVMSLGDLEMKNYYQYTFASLTDGWNLVQIPKNLFVPIIDQAGGFGWQKIQKIQFRTVSRMNAMVIVRFDMLNAFSNSSNFTKDWRVYNDNQKYFLSLVIRGDSRKLVARNNKAVAGILENKRNIRDFIMSAVVSPQSNGRSGLFVRGNYNNSFGYYFMIGGDRSNTWEINKLNKDGWLPAEKIIKGNIGNEVFQKDVNYWLRVEGRGDTMEFFISFDGNVYHKLGEIKDNEFRAGGLGVFVLDGVSTWSTFDSVMVKEL